MKRYDINVLNHKDIPNVLKYFHLQCSGVLHKPSYNNYQQTNLYYYLKNPPSGLLGVYFKPRFNPFKIEYPYADDLYTLEDLLKYEIAIEEAFVFWDAKQKPQEIPPQINLVVSNIFTDQNKEEIINRWLINNNIIKQPKLIKLGCYNATTNTGLVAPLPSRTFHEIDIDAIYFDDGIRIMEENPQKQTIRQHIEILQKTQQRYKQRLKDIEDDKFKQLFNEIIKEIEKEINTFKQEMHQLPGTIEDLLILSNGAKNIYLFIFNTIKRAIHINLPDSLNPYEQIRDWKRANNLYAYEGEYNRESKSGNNPITIIEPTCKEINISYAINLLENTFETEDKIYRITCQDTKPKRDILMDYQKDYIAWLNQCYIKYGCYYSGEEVRNKFDRSSRTIYDENGNTHYYRYVDGVLFDDWYIDGDKCSKTYYRFLDTTPPPKKPDILDS
ncbi:hypothetical protein [Poinsettia branch-inducing phytoplasma]|uniref:hypothetical protein n=1 Tax=Poinsettia branch-inducing phytoplasma TaxID=138647 RepID=UPI00037978EA|nr:hypothetical protein [Poinsettia branch-inducing phytoplasma]